MKRLLIELLILLLIAAPATAREGTWTADELWGEIKYPKLEQVQVQVWVLPENARAFALSNHQELVVLKEGIPFHLRAEILAHELGHILHFRADVDWAEYRQLRNMLESVPLADQKEDFAESFRRCFVPASHFFHRFRSQWGEPTQALCDWLTDIDARVLIQAD